MAVETHPRRGAGRSGSARPAAAVLAAAAAVLAAAAIPAAGQESGVAAEPGEGPAENASVTVQGRVAVEGTGAPVPHAVVRAPGAGRTAVADSAGRYRLGGLPPGEVTLEAVYMGTPVARGQVTLAPGRGRRVDFTISRAATEASELRVEVERRRRGWKAGFEERRRRAQGDFVTREEIRESGLERARQIVVRETPTAKIYRKNRYGDQQLVLRDGAHHCPPAFYVNGVRSPNFTLDRIHPRHIQALEIYDGQDAPARYTVTEGCGVVLVWTRTGGADDG